MVRHGWLALALMLGAAGFAQVTHTVLVDGVKRRALVYAPSNARTVAAPVVFYFHGYGGGAGGGTDFRTAWPQCILVSCQGLPTLKPSTLTWAPGWQDNPGKYRDRDIRYVDALLRSLKLKYKLDPKRLYATGFSNGATFTYLLYCQRPAVFAAFAACDGPAIFLSGAKVPRPIMSVNSAYVAPLARLLAANKAGGAPTVWATNYSLYSPLNSGGAPVVYRQGSWGHSWPSDMTTQAVRFFKAYPMP